MEITYILFFSFSIRQNTKGLKMLKRSISYEDFNGEKVTEVFYFNLTKSELIELEASYQGGLGESLQRIIESNDNDKIVKEFKKLILASYGIKSDDGKRFIKNDQLREEFTQTAAYNELFVELATNDQAAVIFLAGILPKDMQPNPNDTLPTKTLVIPPLAPPSTEE